MKSLAEIINNPPVGDCREVVSAWKLLFGDSAEVTPEMHRSISKFSEHISADEMIGFASRAFQKCDSHDGAFRYFCGCCHNKLKSRLSAYGRAA